MKTLWVLKKLGLFSCSYEKVSSDISDPVKPFNMHKLITVTQGESAMPYQLAYRSVGTDKLFACLVADPNLNELFPDVAIAQETVDAVPKTIRGFKVENETVKSVCETLHLSKVSTESLKEGKVKSRLTALFIFVKTQSDSVGSEQSKITSRQFLNGASSSLARTFTSGSTSQFCIKVDHAGD